jgi:regulator of protease activity HflC (stomatin/prohibitin superfamily)
MHQREREEVTINIGGPIIWWSLAVAAIFGVMTLFMGIFTIDQHERGLVTRWGEVQRVVNPGLNFKTPWIDGLITFSLMEQKISVENQESFSRDTQPANIDADAIYSVRPDKLIDIYITYGNVDNAVKVLLTPTFIAQLKVVYGSYSISEAVTKRQNLNDDVLKALQVALGGNKSLFILHRTPIRDLGLDVKYIDKIQLQMQAEVGVNTKKQELEQKKVDADMIRTQADAEAYQIEARGKAEAAAIEAVNKALTASPEYTKYIAAKNWDGKLPTTMLPNATVPFIGVK